MGKQAGKRRQDAQALFRRGAGMHRAGQLAPAVAAYRSAVLLAPDHADALNNLAAALAAMGRHADAAAAWGRLARLRPGDADAAAGLTAALLADRRPEEALVALAACAGLPPEARLLRLNARALLAMGLTDPALGALHLAVSLQPDDHAVHAELAEALLRARRDGEALPPALQAFRLAPTPDNAVRLSCVLISAGHLDAALEVAEAGLRADTACPEAMVNRAIALESLGRMAEAVAAARDAVAAAPDNPAMRHHLGTTLLATGALTAEAWDLYEARLKLPGVRALPLARLWDGGPLDGRTLLIHAEQGLGDTLQFVRYVPLAAARGGRVVLAVQPSLVRLLKGTPGAAEVVPAGAALPAFDVFVPLLSLPRLFGTKLESVPPPLPYGVPLAPGRAGGLRVGLVWAGGGMFADDRHRSMPAAAMDGLAGVPGVQFVSLQLGAAVLPVGAEDGMAGVEDFAGTATQVAGLDLVIAVDTAVAHLAATMGLPVWMLSRHRGCWRWGHGQADTPWYPGLRLFRQSRPGDWDGVVQEVRAALLAWAGAQAR
jgi:tetratricopeptide (TPR) repeat protein